MKLRILDNSLRFRLGRSEVESFGRSGSIEKVVRFGKSHENDLTYKLEIIDGNEFSGRFVNGNITVSIPRSIVDQWVSSDEVSISGSQLLDEQTHLKFLIEKDFVCLSAHNDEDQSDRYPHPKGPDAC
jgi:hypothetical protein